MESLVGFVLNKDILGHIKRQAMRKRVWFKTLETKERALLNAVILCKTRVRSRVLTSLLEKIVRMKLLRALSSFLPVRVWTMGWRLAQQASRIAVAWGYEAAKQWEHNPDFARFLAINHYV